MQEAGFPDINIICEKVAAEGETRFEDRYRLPIGISVNMTSFSAKLLTSAIYNPRNIMVFSQVHSLDESSVLCKPRLERGNKLLCMQVQH